MRPDIAVKMKRYVISPERIILRGPPASEGLILRTKTSTG
jgi:hypothetical protein